MYEIPARLSAIDANLGTITAGVVTDTRASDPSGRDYQSEISAARDAFDVLRERADAVATTELPPTEALAELNEIDRELSALLWTFPVKNYNAEEIPEGYELDSAIRDLRVWIEEESAKYALHAHDLNVDTRAVANVQQVTPTPQRYRAVVTRMVTQVAVVEFDASPVTDRWALAKELVAQIPGDAWTSGLPGEGYIDTLETVTPGV